MSFIPLMIQGGLVGMIAGMAYPNSTWEFWAVIVANSVLTVAYGAFRATES